MISSNESSLGIYELVDIYKNDPFSYTSISVLRSVGMEVFPNLFS